ncbi:unnamed protein product (macronuclear) [Paramecium tetraurelia]|uniref:Uncharacterized protein n=1 Tax=Paramecium tetraurelia TaxID=5888 RepID=A0C349_PARTE|nr:uncharacterized protein GSPATT00034694001 [Paramecium tetraurelia]CAK65216.1 unnamed protein product [Paramecium tetraurelia]|eukprot:XP_001432613.1 hypothetical protein (macronuclear) [Paramecium tetraurelia strain d4-2]
MGFDQQLMERFERLLPLALEVEGGQIYQQEYQNQPNNSRISQDSYNQSQYKRQQKNQNKGNNQIKDVSLLTKEDIKEYYFDVFLKNKCDKILDLRTCYLYFDMVINLGSENAALIMQKACNQTLEGVINKNTISIANNLDQNKLQKSIIEARKKQFQKFCEVKPFCRKFEKDLNNRLSKIQERIASELSDNDSASSAPNIQQRAVIKNNQMKDIKSKINQPKPQKPITQQVVVDKLKQNQKEIQQIDNKINLQTLNKIKGVDKQTAQFLIDKNDNIHLSDLATVLLVYNDPNLDDKHKGICFSLDPLVLPNQEEFKQQEKVCWPDKFVNRNIIQDTEFAQILFETDYLLKLMSLGVQDDGKTPFVYPKELSDKGLKSCIAFGQGKFIKLLCRFWLVPQQCTYQFQDNKYVVNDIKIMCQARQIERVNSQLQDKQAQDINDMSYQFAEKFTELYDQIAIHYPIFNRLKQLFKAVALGKWMYSNRVRVDYQKLQQSIIKVNNQPKVIPILKYEQIGDEMKIPVNYTKEEKIQKAKDYLVEKGHPTTQNLIDQVVQQIPDLKGYQISQQVFYTLGGIDPNCQNMIAQDVVKEKKGQEREEEEVQAEIPFFPCIKCKECQRMVEKQLIYMDQSKCSVHNDFTCFLCLELVTNEDKEPRCCVINKFKYIFHKECSEEYETILNRKKDILDF